MEARETLESHPEPSLSDSGGMTENELISSVYLLKGNVYQALDNHQFAAQCFKMALKVEEESVLTFFLTHFAHIMTELSTNWTIKLR